MGNPSFSFSLQPVMHWGRGVLSGIGQDAALWGRRAFVVFSPSLERGGHIQRILRSLGESHVAAETMEWSGEPTIDGLAAALAKAKTFQTEVVIGIGGGSAIDMAKAVAGLYHTKAHPLEAFTGRIELNAGIPLITAPSVPGSGAEITPNAVFTHPSTLVKQSMRHPKWVARAVFADAELTEGVPAETLLYSGMDGLCQAIEAYTSIGANAMTDIFARDAARRFAAHLPKALENPADLAARDSLMMASLQGGIALAAARLGAVHGLAHPIGARYNVPHGKACAVLLPMVMRFNLPEAFAKYATLACDLELKEQGMDTYDQAIQYIRSIMNLQKRWEIPKRLRQLGVVRDDLDVIAAEALPSGSLKANPRKMQAADLMALLEENW